MEAGKSYIQKNPLFGRKVILCDNIRESVWDWSLCDVEVVTIDKEPSIVKMKGVASSAYDHQGLTEIPKRLFSKIRNLARMLSATEGLVCEQQYVALRQETLGKIVELLTEEGIIDDSTYDAAHLRLFAEEYDQYSRQQMAQVTDVIDVHK